VFEASPSSGPCRKNTASTENVRARIRRREIGISDLDGIADLLGKGFPVRPRDHWVRALKRLSDHQTPPGFPKYGYFLESKGVPVGVILHIYSSIPINGGVGIRCNLSSWYVEPAFRGYATALASEGLKREDVTFFNVTPARHTLPILEAQGYKRYCRGWFASVPALSASRSDARVEMVSDLCSDSSLQPFERNLLLAHKAYGCISVTCKVGSRTYPFVFMPRRKFGFLPLVYLIYCSDMSDFVQFAGPLGRFLVRAGFPLVVLDSDGPIDGLVGKYLDGRPKYFMGPNRPRLGDLAYSELAMFRVRGERIWTSWKQNLLNPGVSGKRWGLSK